MAQIRVFLVEPLEQPVSRHRHPGTSRWRTSQIVLVAAVAAPFLLLAWSILASRQADRAMAERIATAFQNVECKVIAVAVRPLTRIETIGGHKQSVSGGYDPIIEFEYVVAGQVLRSRRYAPAPHTLGEADAEAFLARFDEGTHHHCRFDPANPTLAFIAP